MCETFSIFSIIDSLIWPIHWSSLIDYNNYIENLLILKNGEKGQK